MNESQAKGIDLLKFLLNREDAKAADTAAWVSVDHQHKMNEEMRRSLRWHQEQVNARQRAQGCDVQDVPDSSSGGGNTLFNCTFNGDKAVQQITKTIGDIGTDPVPPPVQPPVQPLPPQSPPKWWRWVLATLFAALFGAMLVFIAWTIFGGGDPGQQELIGGNLPFQQPEPFTGFDQ